MVCTSRQNGEQYLWTALYNVSDGRKTPVKNWRPAIIVFLSLHAVTLAPDQSTVGDGTDSAHRSAHSRCAIRRRARLGDQVEASRSPVHSTPLLNRETGANRQTDSPAVGRVLAEPGSAPSKQVMFLFKRPFFASLLLLGRLARTTPIPVRLTHPRPHGTQVARPGFYLGVLSLCIRCANPSDRVSPRSMDAVLCTLTLDYPGAEVSRGCRLTPRYMQVIIAPSKGRCYTFVIHSHLSLSRLIVFDHSVFGGHWRWKGLLLVTATD